MKTLILGADGLVGLAISRLIPKAIKLNHEQQDITDHASLFRLFAGERPDVVYLPAAIANVDACEDIKTGNVNVGGTLLVHSLCEMFDAKLVWFSTSYVFNGKSKVPYTEQDATDPIQNYGKQKAAVEKAILERAHKAIIIRTVGVFGVERRNRNFVKSVAASVTSGRKVFAPIDQYMNPIYAADLAQITMDLAGKYNGIWHVAGDETISKYDFALRVADYFGKSRMVEGVTSEQTKQKALRPRMGGLDCSEIASQGYPAPSFEKGLSRFMDAEYG